jgi:sugar transferase (PEP-CTERM/EpsH1 system associated)
MKILHIIDSFGIGGLENGLVNIINRSDPNEFKHEICCIRKSGAAHQRLNKDILIYEVNKREGKDYSVIPKLIKVIVDSRPDIVHTRSWGTVDGIIASRLAGRKNIIHGEHGWSIYDPSGASRKRIIFRKILSFFLVNVVAVSDDIQNWLKNTCKICPAKIRTIINGVDTDKFAPGSDSSEMKTGLFETDDLIIGSVGRLDPIKNYNILIQAFLKLNSEYKKIRLLIVGNGTEFDNLKKIAAQSGVSDKILFLGERRDTPDIYRIIDIFVLPSKNEGISNTILEAMSTSIPVIASNVGGNPELVKDHFSGLLIQPDSVDALEKALKFYINSPLERKQHGENGRKRVLEFFSLDQMVRSYENLYKSIMKSK